MNKITKGLAIVASVAAIGGIGLAAVAQPAGPGTGPPGFMGGHMGPGMMGMHDGAGPRGFADPTARLAALKTDLAIRPEQTVAWDAYAKVVQDSAAQMQAMRDSIDFDALQTMSWQDHQAFMGKLHDKRAQAYTAVKTAAGTLLAALDDTQKTKAQTTLPGLVHAGSGMAWQGGPPMMRHGMGMMFGPMGGGPR